MKAAVLTRLGHIEVTEKDIPEIQSPTEVLLNVKAVGICGTDIHMFKEARADVTLPRIMGHELSGKVVAVGKEVERVKVGDRAVLDPVFACGSCDTCKKGYPNVCKSVCCYGVQMDGGYQEYIVVDQKHLYPFSEKISYEIAALAEPFSIASNILDRIQLKPDEKVLIIGGGTIGLSVLQAAKLINASVMVTDISEDKLKTAAAFGADATAISENSLLEESANKFAPDGFDAVIDAVGIAPLFEKSIEFAAPRGRIACIGFDARPAAIPPVKITKKELSIIGSRMNCGRFPEVMRRLDNGSLKNAEKMITARYSLNDIQAALENAVAHSDINIKTVITVSE